MRALSPQALASPATVPAPTASRLSASAEYFPAFDWLRAVLAVTVMLGHDRVFTWEQSGPLAVQVFFALSGWLIGGILLKTAPADLPRFYFNRALRIWVPYYIALLLLVAVSLLKDRVSGKWLEFVAYKLLMVWNVFGSPQLADARTLMPLQGTGNHFWSVNAEEQFYLLSPLLIVLVPRWGRSPLVWLCLAVLAMATGTVYGSILLGVLAAAAADRYGPWHLGPHAPKVLALGVLAGGTALFLGGRFQVFAPLFAIASVLLLAVPGEASRIGRIAGGMSYPLYLNHWIGVFAGNALLSPLGMRDSPARQLFASVFSIALAVGLYWFVDRQLLERRQAWYCERRGRTLRLLAFGMVGAGVAFGSVVLLAGTLPAAWR